jgi:hypothetical protein
LHIHRPGQGQYDQAAQGRPSPCEVLRGVRRFSRGPAIKLTFCSAGPSKRKWYCAGWPWWLIATCASVALAASGCIGGISEGTQYRSLTSSPRNRQRVFSTHRELPEQPLQKLLWCAAVAQFFLVRIIRQLCNDYVSVTVAREQVVPGDFGHASVPTPVRFNQTPSRRRRKRRPVQEEATGRASKSTRAVDQPPERAGWRRSYL